MVNQKLENNPIEHGSVDSIIGLSVPIRRFGLNSSRSRTSETKLPLVVQCDLQPSRRHPCSTSDVRFGRDVSSAHNM